jgi:hypothetical protein
MSLLGRLKRLESALGDEDTPNTTLSTELWFARIVERA